MRWPMKTAIWRDTAATILHISGRRLMISGYLCFRIMPGTTEKINAEGGMQEGIL